VLPDDEQNETRCPPSEASVPGCSRSRLDPPSLFATIATMLGMTLVWWVASFAGSAHALEHPAVLPGQTGCERWMGGSSGNDRSVRLVLKLCADGSKVTGQMQWSSLVSGWSVREIDGSWNGDDLTMRDLRITESRPERGWQFCTVDRWNLRRSGDRLDGTYDSAACRDHATVWLERIAEPATPGDPPANPSPNGAPTPDPSPTVPSPVPDVPPSPPPEQPSNPPAETPRPRGCGCIASSGPPLDALLIGALGWLAVRRRARR
jgi:hypothetical protein